MCTESSEKESAAIGTTSSSFSQAQEGTVYGNYPPNPPQSRPRGIERALKIAQILTPKPAYKPDPKIGRGGAPTRATTLPDDPAERKKFPLATGVLDYFPDALVAVAEISYAGNEQHNPGQPLHWARGKSTDQDNTIIRHFMARGTRDVDGKRHTAKLVWRALALLQLEIEAEQRGE